MAMVSRFPSVSAYGFQVGRSDRALSRLALYVADLASKGEAGPEDARDILEEFREARRRGAGLARAARASIDTESGAVQVSKLRKCIEVGKQFRGKGVRMLAKTQMLHMKDFSSRDQSKRRYSAEYDALLKVARKAVKIGHVLSEDEIRGFLLKE